MNRDMRYQADNLREREFVDYLRYGTNTTTIQITLIAALEAIIPNIGTRASINLNLIGASGAEFDSVPAFEELLHFLPSLTALTLSFISPNVTIYKSHASVLHYVYRDGTVNLCYVSFACIMGRQAEQGRLLK